MNIFRKIARYDLLSKLIYVKNNLYITRKPNNYQEAMHKRMFNCTVSMFLLLIIVLMKINPLISRYVALICISYFIFDYMCRIGYQMTIKKISYAVTKINNLITNIVRNKILINKVSIANVDTKISKKY